MAEWKFRELRRGDKDRQPTQGEFFSTDAIRSVAEALVREAIQNSLDAVREDEQITVRFHLDRVPWKTAMKYFKGGWQHFSASGNGLDSVPAEGEDCEFIAVEDFGTTGLVGDVMQWRHEPNIRNPFYYFFRTEGRSGKGEAERGRWGLGKYVFPRSSRVNALIALTNRSDDQRSMLMGQAVLKSHSVGEGYYTPDGNYGVVVDDGFVVPEESHDVLLQFSKDFQLERDDKPGLSVVVPWVRSEEISRNEIIYAVIEDYFFPILSGDLKVIVSDQEGTCAIDAESLPRACAEMGEGFSESKLPLLSLAIWARSSERKMWVLNSADRHRPHWDESLIPGDLLEEMRAALREDGRLAIRVPLTVRERGQKERESFFDIFIANDGEADGAPVFIRDGIIISDVRARRVTGIRSLVVVSDRPLANLLGDSENPAHTQWQRDREHFKHKYIYGTSYIDFVSQSVATIIRYLNQADEEPDRELLKDIFSIPKPLSSESPKERSTPRKANAGETLVPDIKIEPRKKRFSLAKMPGGFSITAGTGARPSLLKIVMAYDRRNGTPAKKYSPADFDVGEAPIVVSGEGAEVLSKKFNHMLVRVVSSEFRVAVTGFDENRDLFVDVRVEELD